MYYYNPYMEDDSVYDMGCRKHNNNTGLRIVVYVVLVPCVEAEANLPQIQTLRNQAESNGQGAELTVFIILPVCLLCELLQCLFAADEVDSVQMVDATDQQTPVDLRQLAEAIRGMYKQA